MKTKHVFLCYEVLTFWFEFFMVYVNPAHQAWVFNFGSFDHRWMCMEDNADVKIKFHFHKNEKTKKLKCLYSCPVGIALFI